MTHRRALIAAAVAVVLAVPGAALVAAQQKRASPHETVKAVIETLEQKHPGLKDRLLDDKGVRRFVNIYVGDEDVRFLDGLETKLKSGDEISIVPAIAGG